MSVILRPSYPTIWQVMLSEKSLFADKIHIPIPIDNSVPDIVHSSLNGSPLTITFGELLMFQVIEGIY